MIQNVSHELRTPLTLLCAYSRMLADHELGPLLPEQEEAVEDMRRQATAWPSWSTGSCNCRCSMPRRWPWNRSTWPTGCASSCRRPGSTPPRPGTTAIWRQTRRSMSVWSWPTGPGCARSWSTCSTMRTSSAPPAARCAWRLRLDGQQAMVTVNGCRHRHRAGEARAHLRMFLPGGRQHPAHLRRHGCRPGAVPRHRRSTRWTHLGRAGQGQGSTFRFSLPLAADSPLADRTEESR